MGRLQRSRCTGGPRRYRQILEGHDQRLTLDIIEAEVEVVRDTRSHAAIDVQLFQVLDLLVEAIPQSANTLVFLSHLQLGQMKGLAHSDQLMSSQGTGAHAPLVATAMHLRLEAHARL